jgi:hypothetical protein
MANQEKSLLITDEFIKALETYLTERNKEFTAVKKEDIVITTMPKWDNSRVDVIRTNREIIEIDTNLFIDKVHIDPLGKWGISIPDFKDGNYDFKSIRIYYDALGEFHNLTMPKSA